MAEFKLTPEQTQALHDQAQTLADVEKVIAKAEAAGLDMTEQRARLNYAKQVRSGLIEQFGVPVYPVAKKP